MAGNIDEVRNDDNPQQEKSGLQNLHNEQSSNASLFQPPAPVLSSSASTNENDGPVMEKWSLGILNDRYTEEVPGTVLLLASNRNEPLGLHHEAAQHSSSSLASSMPPQNFESRRPSYADKKRTQDGKILLEPQPDDSPNDPLNWPAWRRDAALLSLGFYCLLGGGMTPILAAGFNEVAEDYDVSYSRVALTTGLYMMGMGLGSVFFSPTAILVGKRPVYLASAIMFIVTSVWCSQAPDYANLATARVFQGFSVSPVECLPSASVAEIYFLHERAFRIGVYTLLLLGGKNLVPLVSAVIIQAAGWRWVFGAVAIIVGFGMALLFFFVPETFWDRTPRPKIRRPSMHHRSVSSLVHRRKTRRDDIQDLTEADLEKVMTPRQQKLHEQNVHAHFDDVVDQAVNDSAIQEELPQEDATEGKVTGKDHKLRVKPSGIKLPAPAAFPGTADPSRLDTDMGVPHLHNLNSPYYAELARNDDYLSHHAIESPVRQSQAHAHGFDGSPSPVTEEKQDLANQSPAAEEAPPTPQITRYTTNLRHSPPKSYVQTLKPWNGRLSRANWFLVALRPFILFAYPSVLWSTLVYSLSVGWLIVLSESVAHIYQNRDTYHFSPLGTGLVYLSPFIGGILGTAVAGKVSDIVVQFMARRNGGVYEPEFRLVMAVPIAVCTAIGLMGFGWSAAERDKWIVPTIFFGIISFGCSLGSTTAITFCVDSYRQYAGEALVTLNLSKNIFHGLVFSLFFPHWLQSDGPKDVFVSIGCIQIACLLTTIPIYIFGKRCRMWTVRRRFMEKF